MERSGTSQLIAIIDDDPSVRIAVQGVLKSVGFATLAFSSAELFLADPRSGEIACVIADVQMPGMSGLDLQARLNQSGRRTPIIFITAFDGLKMRAQALKAGAVAVLGKPFDDTVLIQTLRDAIY